jgi:hypothetical protein
MYSENAWNARKLGFLGEFEIKIKNILDGKQEPIWVRLVEVV